VEAILERERNHPSALPMPGHKIAIPHTDADHVERSAILFARLQKPVEFLSMGGPGDVLQVQMISMFALKEKKRIGDLLETLINVYQHNEILDEILNAAGTDTIYQILRSSVEKYGGDV
jgi:PTS system galactitol-specific IIA component